MHAMLARWSPKMEVSKMSAFTYAGAHMGTVVSLPLTGLLCDAFGWQFVFYAFGALGVIWFVGEVTGHRGYSMCTLRTILYYSVSSMDEIHLQRTG